jgi:CelD/BcsL family acetyltransferase involved in cellulose biosynthesis
MIVELLNDWHDVCSHYTSWERILEANPALTIFSTPEWLQAWWESYGHGATLQFLLLREESGQIIALVPLFVTISKSPLGRLPLARLVGDGSDDSENLEFVCLPGREAEVAFAVLQWVKESDCCDLCQLNTLPSPGALVDAVEQITSSPSWSKIVRTRPRVLVRLPATWEDYLKLLSSNERGKIGRRARRLEKRYTTEYLRCSLATEIDCLLESLFCLHHLRRTHRGQPGSFSISERRTFYRKIAAAFLRRGWLELWTLRLNRVPVASQFIFTYKGVAYILQEGFDRNYYSDSVGYVLRSHVIRQMIEKGMRAYDFLGGDDKYKLRWSGESGVYIDVHVAPKFSRDGMYLACHKNAVRIKEWVRKQSHPNLYDTLKTVAIFPRSLASSHAFYQNHQLPISINQTQLLSTDLRLWS